VFLQPVKKTNPAQASARQMTGVFIGVFIDLLFSLQKHLNGSWECCAGIVKLASQPDEMAASVNHSTRDPAPIVAVTKALHGMPATQVQ
jgi:hypothetical protein